VAEVAGVVALAEEAFGPELVRLGEVGLVEMDW
jgi:hypothetical protein